MGSILGIHHVTGICGDAQQNVDFYAGVLGLRLVKLTVNFDDPGTYHLYYGDGAGSPGTVLTFFPYPNAQQGRRGVGQVTTTVLAVPVGSLDYWDSRLRSHEVECHRETTGADQRGLCFEDPDGMRLGLMESSGFSSVDWKESTVAKEHAIQGIRGAMLSLEGFENTAKLLRETMGFRESEQQGSRYLYEAGQCFVELVCQPDAERALSGRGTVHHIAFRSPNEAEQLDWRNRLADEGYNVSPVMDRNYFHSIYYREPGGVLFEIATDPPGFTVDEPADRLGTTLKLPHAYEQFRLDIERLLPRLELPALV